MPKWQNFAQSGHPAALLPAIKNVLPAGARVGKGFQIDVFMTNGKCDKPFWGFKIDALAVISWTVFRKIYLSAVCE